MDSDKPSEKMASFDDGNVILGISYVFNGEGEFAMLTYKDRAIFVLSKLIKID